MSIDATALPSELLVLPQPLVGFCGLDLTRSVHKSIWDAFNNGRKPEKAGVQYKLLPHNYEFPVAKPKRGSYEWYHPKGILKRNWMVKHLHMLPAVVVLFQEMEWNDPQWSEKQVQCASLVQALKTALQERYTRICLVLLQKAAPLPSGEDQLASDRATSLATACGINSKMLFILPHTEHLMGYTLRLESAFVDMAQSYYALVSKRIRTHRDQLTSAHITLKIRHQFKLGFISEIRQDFSTALKHYTQAYSTLEELRITDTNCLEIKIIAGFLNYKICRLMFKLKVPRDSINHFISHIEKYKNRTGFKDLVFEHYAWLSAQHSVFGELFCDAIKNGLPALQTQHPGIYFHKAAEYIARRREACLQSSAMLPSPTEPNSPTTLQNNNSMALYTEFFGVHAAKTGETMSEQQINTLIQENENSFNHSSAIINLLGQAMAQFKIYKCLRFRKKLAIDMAEEYFKCGDHAKALTLYSLMLPDYRQDKWPSIFSDVLLKTLRCALLSASITDYVSCSIEALSPKIRYTQNERELILENLKKLFQCKPPLSQSQNAPEICDLWESALLTVKSPILIDLDKLSDLFETCATFQSGELLNDEIIKVYLIVKLLTDIPLKINGLSILLTDGTNIFKLQPIACNTFTDLLEVRESHCQDSTATPISPSHQKFDNNVELEPAVYYKFVFTTESQQFLENTRLRVTRIEVQIGTDKLTAVLSKNAAFACNVFRHYNRCKDLDDNIVINPICYIVPTFHLVTQTNIGNEPMLVNEYHSVVTTISNPHNVFLQNVGLHISVPEELRNKAFLATDISPSRQKLHSHIQIDIGDLSMQGLNTISFYLFSLVEAEITLQQKVWYTIDIGRPKISSLVAINDSLTPNSADTSPENARTFGDEEASSAPVVAPVEIEFIDESRLRKTKEDTFSVKCELEFKFEGRFYTLSRMPLRKIYRSENFLFRANIEVQTESAVDILETYFICDHNLVQSTYSFRRKTFTSAYQKGEKLEDVIVLRANATLDNWITAKELERQQSDPLLSVFRRSHNTQKHNHPVSTPIKNDALSGAVTTPSSHMNKSLMSKIATTMTIISNTASSNSLMVTSQSSNLSSSTISDDGGKTALTSMSGTETDQSEYAAQTSKSVSTRLVFNKAMEAIQATGHCRGFIKSVLTADPPQHHQHAPPPIFGVYCIKWRRSGSKEENESKFVIDGMDVAEPPLNIYCSIEEKMFVKMPMTFKVTLKNPTPKVQHLIATLSISNADNFICSGHKQLDITIFAYGEMELVYNLYPLCVGWQKLPELALEYNAFADPSKDEAQNNLLSELVQRSIPKQVFVLPPLKQQIK